MFFFHSIFFHARKVCFLETLFIKKLLIFFHLILLQYNFRVLKGNYSFWMFSVPL